MEDYRLHLRITTLGSPSNGQPHAGGPGSGDVIVDHIIDLRQWVAERGGLIEPVVAAAPVVEPTPEPVKPAVTPPAPRPAITSTSAPVAPTSGTATAPTPAKPASPAVTTVDAPAMVTVPDDDTDGRSAFDPSR